MNRREMLKGAAALPIVAAGAVIGKEACGDSVYADFSRVNPDGSHPAIPKPYDPVAVLEAMRGAGFWFEISPGDEAGWMIVFQRSIFDGTINFHQLPDFRSAVLWLHGQAAAVDAGFAAKWPVPE